VDDEKCDDDEGFAAAAAAPDDNDEDVSDDVRQFRSFSASLLKTTEIVSLDFDGAN
jgi:hypothetical protein